MIVIFVVYIYSVKKNNYEELIVDMIKRGIVLDHSKSPCEENFIPDKKVMIIMLVMNRTFFPNMLRVFRFVLRKFFGLSQPVLLIHLLGFTEFRIICLF
jgi:hypothetical protein